MQACRQGEHAGAQEYYSQYKQRVEIAHQTVDALGCGAGSSGSSGSSFDVHSGRGGTDDSGREVFYNLCIKIDGYTMHGSCYGPSEDLSCGSANKGYSHIGYYKTQSSCISARENRLDEFGRTGR